jgi:hypothetical protein
MFKNSVASSIISTVTFGVMVLSLFSFKTAQKEYSAIFEDFFTLWAQKRYA